MEKQRKESGRERRQQPSGRQDQQGGQTWASLPTGSPQGQCGAGAGTKQARPIVGISVTFSLEARPSHSSLDPGLGDPSLSGTCGV